MTKSNRFMSIDTTQPQDQDRIQEIVICTMYICTDLCKVLKYTGKRGEENGGGDDGGEGTQGG